MKPPNTDQGALIGRRAEVGAIETLLDDLTRGSRALIFRGPAGIGKSTLLREGISRAGSLGYRVFATQPFSSERSLPYVTLGDLLGDWVDDVLEKLPDPQATALEAALLRRTSTIPPDPHGVALATSTAIQLMVGSGPALFAIDDAQWVDADSARALAFALRRVTDLHVGLLAAYRQTGNERPTMLQDLPAGWARDYTLGPLGVNQLQTMLREQLNVTIPFPIVRRIALVSEGNPLFALEIGHQLTSLKEMPGPHDPLPIESDLTAQLSHRLSQLPTDSFELLVHTALAEVPHREVILATATNNDTASDALQIAVDAQIVDIKDDLIRFRHPLYASEALDACSPDNLAAAHRRLATLIADPDTRVWHRAMGLQTPDANVAAEVAALAHRSHRQGAPEASAAFYELAAALTPDENQRWERFRDAGLRHMEAGDAPRAQAMLERLIDEGPSGSFRIQALSWLTELMWNDLATSKRLAERALEESGDDLVALGRAHDALAWVAIDAHGPTEVARFHNKRLAEIAEQLDDAATRGAAEATLAEISFYAGDPAWREQSKLSVDYERLSDITSFSTPRVLYAWRLIRGGELEESRPWLDEALRDARATNAISRTWSPLVLLAELDVRAGRWEKATAEIEEGAELAFAAGSQFPRLRGLTVGGIVRMHTGPLPDARRLAEEALKISERAGHVYFIVTNRSTLGAVELARGDPVAAMKWYDSVPQTCADAGIVEPALEHHWPGIFFALTAVGEVDRAEELATDLRSRSERTGRHWGIAFATIGKGLVEGSRGKPIIAEALLLEGLSVLSEDQHHLARAWTWMAVGRTRRAGRQKRSAQVAFAHAQRILEDMGSHEWAALVQEEIQRTAGTASPTGLTATEQKIAELASLSRTNNEIAAELYLSTKTVEANMTRILAKLGLTSRRSIAAALQRLDNPPK